ncbi:hypothetical protein I2750_19710 [Bacillus sp. PR5]|nr:hypothetical protein [Bacillus sp. PR5]
MRKLCAHNYSQQQANAIADLEPHGELWNCIMSTNVNIVASSERLKIAVNGAKGGFPESANCSIMAVERHW